MLTSDSVTHLEQFSKMLVNQERARVIIEPQRRATGFWFGGGNMIEFGGALYLSGRYRNFGDSRSGLGQGERGLELAIFRSADRGITWEKVVSFSKPDLDVGGMRVLSIEGSALHRTARGVELFLSTEKVGRRYAEGLGSFQKEGTGIWSIDRIAAPSIEELKSSSIEEVLRCDDPQYVHVKDPFVYDSRSGATVLGFCTHPFNWASSNTGYMVLFAATEEWSAPIYDHFRRGTTWDAGMSRATAAIDVPAVGDFSNTPKTSLLFYDGGESVRNLDEHKEAVSRPRGYSCEELGGAAYFSDENFGDMHRLSKYLPFFVSPMGAGTSRYVDVLQTDEGFYATWQQSQTDHSQPLVMNFVTRSEAEKALRKRDD
jgi:hypothetical protein